MNERMLSSLIEFLKSFGIKLIAVAAILIIGFKLTNMLAKLIKKGKGLPHLDAGVKTFAASFTNITLKILVVISAAGILGLPMTSFITILGSAGIAVGLALQGSLSNIAGGLILLVFKPFKVGDFISTTDISGTVSEIGIFYTKVTSIDNKIFVIPNGNIAGQTLTNYNANPIRRIDLQFCAGYECDIQKVKSVLLETAENHPLVLKNPAPFAGVWSHDDSAVRYELRIWCKSEEYWDLYFDMEEKIKTAFDKNSISIPYQQIDININRE